MFKMASAQMSVDLQLRQSQEPMFILIRPVITQKQQRRTMKSKIEFWPVRSSPGSKILHLIIDTLSSEFFLMYFCSFKMQAHTYAHICGFSALFHMCLHLSLCFLYSWLLCPLSAMFLPDSTQHCDFTRLSHISKAALHATNYAKLTL